MTLPSPKSAPDWSVAILIVGFVLIPFLISRFGTSSLNGGSQISGQDTFREAFPAAAAAADKSSVSGAGIVPPGWVFALVWSLLYAAMGTSLWFALRDPPKKASGNTYAIWVAGLVFFSVGVVLNWAWMPTFSSDDGGTVDGERNALWILLGALASTAVATVLFLQTSIPAAACLTPLLVWYGYALLLNVRVVERGTTTPKTV